MKEGIWLCNMTLEDYNKLKDIYEPLSEVQVGLPRATRTYNTSELEEMGYIGLYTTSGTSFRSYESLTLNNKKKKKYRKERVIELVDEEDYSPDIPETISSVEKEDEINLLEFLDD